jgi:CheY-like chemotaxis protein
MKDTILVIDDQPRVCDVLSTMLEASGYPTVVAHDGKRGAALLENPNIIGALVDVDMPGPNGVEVCRELRRAAAAQKRPFFVWLMTGVMREEISSGARAAGALGVLAKPFTTKELLARVAQMVMLGAGDHASA